MIHLAARPVFAGVHLFCTYIVVVLVWRRRWAVLVLARSARASSDLSIKMQRARTSDGDVIVDLRASLYMVADDDVDVDDCCVVQQQQYANDLVVPANSLADRTG